MANLSRKPIGIIEKEYIASGDWKCPDLSDRRTLVEL